MRYLFPLFAALLLLTKAHDANAFASIACGLKGPTLHCVAAIKQTTSEGANLTAYTRCAFEGLGSCRTYADFDDGCLTIEVPKWEKSEAHGWGPNRYDAQEKALSLCTATFGPSCREAATVCERSNRVYDADSSAQGPAAILLVGDPEPNPANSGAAEGDWGAIINVIVQAELYVSLAALALNLILLAAVILIIRWHKRRVFILGLLTVSISLTLIASHLLAPILLAASLPGLYGWIYLITYTLERAAPFGIFVAGVPFVTLLTPFLLPIIWPAIVDPFEDRGISDAVPKASKRIEVLIARSQRMNWLRRVVFMIDARLGVSREQLELMKKYRLGRTIVFDSARRERQNELARTHLQMASDKRTLTICLWREEWRGIFRRLYYLIRALFSFMLGFLFIRITLAKLIRGAHVESRSLDTILATKNAIERAAGDLKAYLEVAETFDGREDLYEPT
jgi:hypothetical protein